MDYQDNEGSLEHANNKNSRDEVIEYDPNEMSYDGSEEVEDYYEREEMIPSQSYADPYPCVSERNLMVTGKAIPIYG